MSIVKAIQEWSLVEWEVVFDISSFLVAECWAVRLIRRGYLSVQNWKIDLLSYIELVYTLSKAIVVSHGQL